jgi:hypothetical protein
MTDAEFAADRKANWWKAPMHLHIPHIIPRDVALGILEGSKCERCKKDATDSLNGILPASYF